MMKQDIHPHHDAILQACRLLETAEAAPRLIDLSAAAGLSPFHFQRLFKQVVGVTPRQYYAARRAERLQAALQSGEGVTQAIYQAGYGSSSRFYSQSGATLGMTPSQFKRGGAQLQINYAVQPCDLGQVLVAATETGVCAIMLGDTPDALEQNLRQRFPLAQLAHDEEQLSGWVGEVVQTLKSPAHSANLPLDIRGTAFQHRVWAALQEIPRGQTTTYEQIATRIGQPKAARAVANACANNKIAVVIPCHRVVRKDGGLGGYRWGLARKKALLENERQ
jgi:AraC family transcriptional regulator of adaptative response/methylated-DNA-[protein]-cysteine methyltransferase